jgi:two-component system sensor histidine kinase/response regulator
MSSPSASLEVVVPQVLVVDDDKDIRESLAQILVEEGFDVSSAENGKVALEEIARRVPDVVLLDLMMPVMNGWQVLETLRSSPEHAQIQVVVLSAFEAPGAVDFIEKPIQLPRLLALLELVRVRATTSARMRAASRVPRQ